MACIEQIIRDSRTEMAVCLNAEECKHFLPLVEKEVAKAEKKRDYYQDILDSGEASTRQQNSLDKAEDKLSALESIKNNLEVFIQRYAG